MRGLDEWFRRSFPGLTPEPCLVLTDVGFRLLDADGSGTEIAIDEITKVTCFRRFAGTIDLEVFDVSYMTSKGEFTIAFADLTKGFLAVLKKLEVELPRFLVDWYVALDDQPFETPIVVFSRDGLEPATSDAAPC